MAKLGTKEVLRVAVEADVDERTVRRRLNGEAMQPRNKERVDKALRTLGLEAFIPAESPKEGKS